MSDLAIQQHSAKQRWPMTAEALRILIDELSRLRADVAGLAGGSGVGDGVVHLPLARAARRLEMLAAVLDDPEQGWISADSPLGAAVLGCRPGERAEVIAPAGRRAVIVLSIE